MPFKIYYSPIYCFVRRAHTMKYSLLLLGKETKIRQNQGSRGWHQLHTVTITKQLLRKAGDSYCIRPALGRKWACMVT